MLKIEKVRMRTAANNCWKVVELRQELQARDINVGAANKAFQIIELSYWCMPVTIILSLTTTRNSGKTTKSWELWKGNKSWRTMSAVVKTVWYPCKDTYINQRNKEPRKNPHMSGLMIFLTRMPRSFNGGKHSVFNKWCRENWTVT